MEGGFTKISISDFKLRRKLRRAGWKGKQSELRQCKRMEQMGWSMVRVPTSAAGTTILPDLFGYHPERQEFIAAEWKSRKRYAYIKTKQLNKVLAFLKKFEHFKDLGMKLTPLIGCRFGTGRGVKTVWKIITPDQLNNDFVRIDKNMTSNWKPN